MRRTLARPQVIDMNITLIADHLLMISDEAVNTPQKYYRRILWRSHVLWLRYHAIWNTRIVFLKLVKCNGWIWLIVYLSWDSVVGIATWLRVWANEDIRSIPGKGQRFFSFCIVQSPLGRTQPPMLWVPQALFPGIRQPGREADHSPPSNAKNQHSF